ncbi:MAG TPA: phospholipase D-like domain-containing protein [Rhodocyclaceae bacterium]|nr:phospholipase D-like domain-containing protein [Rhodocyclaceae bacterium]
MYDATESRVTKNYFATKGAFAPPRKGNKVQPLINGAEVLAAIAAALKSAQKFILIADWQFAFDVQLERNDPNDFTGRLSYILGECVRRGVHVRVLVYDGADSTPATTYDDLVTRQFLEFAATLKKQGAKGSLEVIQHGPTTTQLDSWEYSHHQKFVVVDGCTAFIGGIDLTYGRWDTNAFDIVIDPTKYRINEMYNPCLSYVRRMTATEKRLTTHACGSPETADQIHKEWPGFAPAYLRKSDPNYLELLSLSSTSKTSNFGSLLDEGFQPRMPWQDAYAMIEGPSAFDVYKNFARRWNMARKHWRNTEEALQARSMQLSPILLTAEFVANSIAEGYSTKASPTHKIGKKWLNKIGALKLMQANLNRQDSQIGCEVQIVRSVSTGHIEAENAVIKDDVAESDIGMERSAEIKIVEQGLDYLQPDTILQAMIDSIKSAKSYIYIETQFFNSNYKTSGAKNKLLAALKDRLAQSIGSGTPFHIFIVLPVHPEGTANAEATMFQHQAAQRAIFWDDDGLVDSICQYLVIKKNPTLNPCYNPIIRAEKTPENRITKLTISDRKTGTPISFPSFLARDQELNKARLAERKSGGWKSYLTVLNLRNVGVVCDYKRHVTSDSSKLRKGIVFADTNEQLFANEIGRYLVTEQIYVHSKLMIVDDAVAIIGSANCNDRSLSGNGDTEIAGVFVDGDITPDQDLGNGLKVNVRKFARDLRWQLWQKHLGLLISDDPEKDYFKADSIARNENNTPEIERILQGPPVPGDNKSPNASVPHPPRFKTKSSWLDDFGITQDELRTKPVSAKTIKALQSIATHNTALIESVFVHTPRNEFIHPDTHEKLKNTYGTGLDFYPERLSEKRTITVPHTVLKRNDAPDGHMSAVSETTQVEIHILVDQGVNLGGKPPPLAPLFMKTPDEVFQKAHGYFRYQANDNLFRDKQGKIKYAPPFKYAYGKVHDLKKAVAFLTLGSDSASRIPGLGGTPFPIEVETARTHGLIGFIQAFPERWGHDQPFTQSELDAVTLLKVDMR